MEGKPVGYLHNAVKELNWGLPRTNPDSGRLEDLNQGPPAITKMILLFVFYRDLKTITVVYYF